MRPPRRRVDNTQAVVVAALREVGAVVAITSHVGQGFPDLVCGRNGRTVLLEVKTEPGSRLTPDEQEWHWAWRGGPLVVVRTPAEALWAMGVDTGEERT